MVLEEHLECGCACDELTPMECLGRSESGVSAWFLALTGAQGVPISVRLSFYICITKSSFFINQASSRYPSSFLWVFLEHSMSVQRASKEHSKIVHQSLKYLVLFRFNRTTCECGCPVSTFGQVSYGVIKVSNRSGLNITASQSKGNVSVSKVSRTFPSVDSLSLFPIVPTWKVQCICHLKILNSFTTFYGYILKFRVCKSYYSIREFGRIL